MKILVVTNLYPPHHVGGYELGCRDVVELLRGRGHEVFVLTSTFRVREAASAPEDANVHRLLWTSGTGAGPLPSKGAECQKLIKAYREFAADLVYFWNQGGLCQWLPVVASWLRWPMAFFLSDTNFVSWRVGAWLAGPARRSTLLDAVMGKSFLVVGWPVMRNRPCHFASQFLRDVARQEAIPVAERGSAVIHWGIDPARFRPPAEGRWPLRRILYAGQMIPQKGVHTAIAAFGLLARESAFADFTLTLAGGGHAEYEKQLREMAAQLKISDRVHFLGRVPRLELPGIYVEHDVLLFPSEWEEPFAITPLEAMAAGLVVVGTTTGGSGELFRNRETAMTFAAGDAADGARAIRELCADPTLVETIRRRALHEVTARYTLASMVDRIEGGLQSMANAPS